MKKDNSKGELNQGASPTKNTFLTDQKAKQPVTGDDAQVRKRQEQALMFEKYLEESGLSLSF